MKKFILLTLSLFVFGLSAQEHLIKFAALPPKGTAWMNILEELDQSLRAKSNGELGFKIYPNGTQGREKQVVQKMRFNQIQAAGLTGVGLGKILPEMRILDAPFLFRNKEEVDYVSAKLFDVFAKKFESEGYILLGWAEVGFVRVFSTEKITSFDEMKEVKMWSWEGDPVAKYTFDALSINPIPLSIEQVITSLQSGIINSVYISPLAAVALQWHTRVNYMYDVRLANANGAVVITKRAFNKLPAKYQKLLREEAAEYFSRITASARADNEKSIELMKQFGIEIVNPFTEADMKKFAEAGRKARRAMVGELYDEALLQQVESAIAEFRAKQ
jgi:TRAP-type C4-dicarboxylate transport system substrate-binding protein